MEVISNFWALETRANKCLSMMFRAFSLDYLADIEDYKNPNNNMAEPIIGNQIKLQFWSSNCHIASITDNGIVKRIARKVVNSFILSKLVDALRYKICPVKNWKDNEEYKYDCRHR